MDGEKILGEVNNRIKPEGSKNPTSTLFYPLRDSDVIGLGGEVWLLFSFESPHMIIYKQAQETFEGGAW